MDLERQAWEKGVGKMATGNYMPHGSSGEDGCGYNCLAPKDAMQGAIRLSVLLLDLRPPLRDKDRV